jgi:hypothetical protein
MMMGYGFDGPLGWLGKGIGIICSSGIRKVDRIGCDICQSSKKWPKRYSKALSRARGLYCIV